MAKHQENFWAWRLQIFGYAILGLFIVVSLFKRAFYYFFGLLIVLFVAVPAHAFTWNDVAVELAKYQDTSTCIYFVSSASNASGSGYRIWKRCNGGNYTAFTQGANASFQYSDLSGGAPVCYGVAPSNINKWRSLLRIDKTVKCDGTVNQVNTAQDLGTAQGQADPCWSSPNIQNGCTALDTLIAEFIPVVNDCSYNTLEVFGAKLYTSVMAKTGTTSPCNACIPAGTIPDISNPSHGMPRVSPPDTVSCYWEDITGDPAAPADPYIPPVNGTGGVGNTGPQTSTQTTTETKQYTIGSSTETVTTQTTTTTRADGSTSVSTVSTVANCIDSNADGISDVSKLPCNVSITSTSDTPTNPDGGFQGDGTSTGTSTGGGGTAALYPTVTAPAAYSVQDVPPIGDFGALFTDFATNIQTTQLFSKFSLSDMLPSGSGTPTYAISFGSYGSANLDFTDYATPLSYIKGFMLLLASYLAVRVVVLKR